MSEYYYYGMAVVMLLTTSWTFAAVRWFHTCRAPKKEHRYIWPDRKLQVLVYLCSVVLVPYAVNPTSEAAWVLMKSYLVGTWFFYCGLRLAHFEQYQAQHPNETKESAAIASGYSSYNSYYRAKQKFERQE